MASFKRITTILLASTGSLALASCGADDIASPGGSGPITINNPAAPPPPPPPPGPPPVVTPASVCPSITDPQGLTNVGTITGPTGTYLACRLPSVIRSSITLPKVPGVIYEMNGRVNVGCDGGFAAPTVGAPFTSTTLGCSTPLTADTNVTLTISPGAIIYANSGDSWLAVNRGNRINAVGTATQPIIFTSRQNVEGNVDDSSQQQWGGVVLLGRGIITDCVLGSVVGQTCERDTEGAANPARYGGRDNTYNAGRMSFVQIRFSGFPLAPNRELQSLTPSGVGTGTVLDHIHSHNSSDDGAEFFGGAVNLKYYIATGADDDGLDVDVGSQANVQYMLLLPRTANGDALFEIDSTATDADVPRTVLNVVNFTVIQPQASPNNESADLAAALFRGNSDTTLANGVFISPNNECIRINGSSVAGSAPATLTARSVVLQCNATRYLGSGTITAAQVATAFGSGSNNNNDTFTNTLTNVFINGTAENAVAGFNATSLSAYFDATTYIGAVRNAADNWYAGWACNTATVSFGPTSSLCTTLPTN